MKRWLAISLVMLMLITILINGQCHFYIIDISDFCIVHPSFSHISRIDSSLEHRIWRRRLPVACMSTTSKLLAYISDIAFWIFFRCFRIAAAPIPSISAVSLTSPSHAASTRTTSFCLSDRHCIISRCRRIPSSCSSIQKQSPDNQYSIELRSVALRR